MTRRGDPLELNCNVRGCQIAAAPAAGSVGYMEQGQCDGGQLCGGQSSRQGTHRRPRRLKQGTISKELPNLRRPALRGKRARSGLRAAAAVVDLKEEILQADALGWTSFDMGRTALLNSGSIQIVVSEHVGVGGNHPIVYRRFGIDLYKFLGILRRLYKRRSNPTVKVETNTWLANILQSG